MKKVLLLLFVLLVVSGCSHSFEFKKPEFKQYVKFVRTYGGSKNEVATSVTKTSDLGYAVLGYTQSNNGDIKGKKDNSYDLWVLKFSSDDNLEWQKTYGSSSDDKGNKIIQTTDGGYVITGYTKGNDKDVSKNAGGKDLWLAKLNGKGTIVWQKSFGYSGNDKGLSIIQTTDGGLLLVGELDVSAKTQENAEHKGIVYWVIKLDKKGEKQWSKNFGGNLTDSANSVAQLPDDGFIIFGSSNSTNTKIANNKGSYDFKGVRVSKSGETIWEKNYGGTAADKAQSITQTKDGNYLIAGSTKSNDKDIVSNKGKSDAWIIKIDPYGKMLWQNTIGYANNDFANTVVTSTENGFILAGTSYSKSKNIENKGENDAWIFKVDESGKLKWQFTLGGSKKETFNDVTELHNGNIIAVGETTSTDKDIKNNKGLSDVLIVKIN